MIDDHDNVALPCMMLLAALMCREHSPPTIDGCLGLSPFFSGSIFLVIFVKISSGLQHSLVFTCLLFIVHNLCPTDLL